MQLRINRAKTDIEVNVETFDNTYSVMWTLNANCVCVDLSFRGLVRCFSRSLKTSAMPFSQIVYHVVLRPETSHARKTSRKCMIYVSEFTTLCKKKHLNLDWHREGGIDMIESRLYSALVGLSFRQFVCLEESRIHAWNETVKISIWYTRSFRQTVSSRKKFQIANINDFMFTSFWSEKVSWKPRHLAIINKCLPLSSICNLIHVAINYKQTLFGACSLRLPTSYYLYLFLLFPRIAIAPSFLTLLSLSGQTTAHSSMYKIIADNPSRLLR